ncbi:MAG: type II toxin-antitoxin system ParD family antitoxin [Hyphomonadaceae bacterium]|jgi:antitoxin ParD1/3/4|uniref:type II toxin-antitoxin system ParD family antitoxin n=1 Tax=Aquidulcibacter sp. TaxID=2052990 RepID=UPI0022BD5AFB|nr:type II toxin-antitoxin system ParD family antitoxin [Aquidulcibacter sp.]MCE2890196.1 type II toxin-antitoxin system ParD family antitoxin [Hyphomonadaceae bacterium]MCZ8206852.1 type II toxin-antitoxin system ParD family antitoxin [Aquidulcibacter sp.]
MSSSYSLGPHFDAFIQEQLASARYASASEVVRAGLRLLEEHEANRHVSALSRAEQLEVLKAEIQRGVDSPKVDGETAMKGLKGRIAKRNADLAAHETA